MADFIDLEDLDRSELAEIINEQLLLEGGTPSEWWRTQERLFVTQTVRTIRAGVADGLSSRDIAANLQRNVFGPSRRQAQAIVDTAISAAATQTRLALFNKNKRFIKGYQQVSILDGRTSDICIAYAGAAWTLDGEPIGKGLPFNGGPPRHFRCRSSLIPVLRAADEIPGVTFTDRVRDLLDGAIAGALTFNAWLRDKTKSFQDKVLGPAKARLWRSNKITLSQLVDMRGNPLTVEELKEKSKTSRTGNRGDDK